MYIHGTISFIAFYSFCCLFFCFLSFFRCCFDSVTSIRLSLDRQNKHTLISLMSTFIFLSFFVCYFSVVQFFVRSHFEFTMNGVSTLSRMLNKNKHQFIHKRILTTFRVRQKIKKKNKTICSA